ncbi:hypothetical protein NBRC116188_00070 [Oceaniserpentilla sp. 4NH20-0058]|uniref:hypothetical protein n=1 Tax=Oceaniserpentilla sp. 4NH20-0058 TaxID=3127660 RepID=UPI0031063F73
MGNSALDWVYPVSSHIEMLLVFKDDQVLNVLDKNQMDLFLDGDEGLKERSGTYKAVYVQTNFDWLLQSIVCFYVNLDNEGYMVEQFPLPLQRMCDTAGPGPDFGAGRIRLACKSQCPISGYKTQLWDPSTVIFSNIQEALEQSKGALFQASTEPQDEDPVTTIKRTLRNEEAAYRNLSQQLQQELEQQKLINERLQKQINQFEKRKATHDEISLRQENEALSMQVRKLQLVLEKAANKVPLEQNIEISDSQLIEALDQQDVMSVVFHHGVGHINLTPHKILDYLEDPIEYAAHQVGLSKYEYKVWLKHHDHPHCVVCDEKIALIGNPKIFDAQIDVYCERHKPLE